MLYEVVDYAVVVAAARTRTMQIQKDTLDVLVWEMPLMLTKLAVLQILSLSRSTRLSWIPSYNCFDWSARDVVAGRHWLSGKCSLAELWPAMLKAIEIC